MNYYVARNGQQYGPYTEETVRNYLSAGSLFVSDNIREESGQTWTTIGQLFQIVPTMTAPAAQPYAVQQAQPYAQPYYVAQPQTYGAPQTQVVPPNLHWAIVLILSITWIFPMIWAIVQARFAKRIDPSSNAVWTLTIWLVLSIFLLGIDVAVATGDAGPSGPMWQLVLLVAVLFCYYSGIYGIRRAMLNHYNSVEPIQLQLSGVMTFFFGILYLQYHMSRIARWKTTGILES